MRFTLRNGEEVEIRELDNNATAKQFRDFIGKIVREKPQPFVTVDKTPSLTEEKKWLKDARERVRKGIEVKLIAWRNGDVIGVCDATKQRGVKRDKALVGISIARQYRGQGLGKKLLIEIVKLAKKKLKPRIIYLTVFEGNKPALTLYEKVGFRKIAVLPKWVKVRGRYWDYVFMRLK